MTTKQVGYPGTLYEIVRDLAEREKRPFYWTKVADDPQLSAPSGWYQWQKSGLVYLGEKFPVGAQEENTK